MTAIGSIAVPDRLSVTVDKLDASRWYTLLDRFDDANIYQTWGYGAVHWSSKELSHLVLHRGGNPIAMAQLRLVRAPLLNKGVAYLRWGPLFRLRGEPVDVDVLREIIVAIRNEYVGRRGYMLRILPPIFDADSFAGTFLTASSAVGLGKTGKSRVYRTVRLDLSPSLEVLRKQLGAKWRNKLNGAERNELAVTEGTSLELYNRFMVAYRQLMARKQFETTVDVGEFRTIQEQLPEPLRMRIFICEKEERLLNALVVSAIGDTAIYLLGATTDEGMKLKGAYLLQWRAIQWLKERGCRWYDLGGINPEVNPGVYEFKSGFGGQETSQLGTFELPGDWISNLCVQAGERGQSVFRRLRQWAGSRRSASAR